MKLFMLHVITPFSAAYLLALTYRETKLFVELPQNPDTPKFLNELKKARDCEYMSLVMRKPVFRVSDQV